MADPPAFLLRIADVAKSFQETSAGLDDVQVGLEMAAKRLPHRLLLPLPQQSIIDEDASDLSPDGLYQEGSRDRGIDTAGQAADHAG